ncbi:UNVERIFIED_CONTAM: hypothetical protein GTU68_038825 [Idotea baltica]|nr:hypothetical protein [Idotea baltica]
MVFENAHKGFNPTTLLNEVEKYAINKAIVSSVGVVPELDATDYPVTYFNHTTLLPIKNNYHTPTTLGLDRLAGVVAAYFLFPKQNCLVIDAGTCTTFDFITANGTYEGGSIHPGIEMRTKAMNNFTHRLPLVNVRFTEVDNDSWLGKSTEECLQAGAIWGAALEIDGMAERYKKLVSGHKNTDLTIIITGGAATLLERCTKKQIFARPFLILEGLNQILNYNEHTLH